MYLFHHFELDQGSTKDSVNDRLQFVREECPHLVTVAATLLPFGDVLEQFGLVKDENDDVVGLAVEVTTANVDFAHHACVTADNVRLVVQDPVDEEVIGQYRLTLAAFWEWLRLQMRPVSSFGPMVEVEDES